MNYRILPCLLLILILLMNCGGNQEPLAEQKKAKEKAIPEENISVPDELTPEDRLDDIFGKFRTGNLVFNVPDTMKLNSSQGIHLVLSVDRTVAALRKIIKEDGVLRERSVQVSQIMAADLKGPGFKVENINPALQVVNFSGETEWRWEITAIKPGVQRLYLTLNAIVNIDGQERPYTLMTHQEEINIYVTIRQKISGFVGENWEWLWSAVLVPFIGWLWEYKRKKRKS